MHPVLYVDDDSILLWLFSREWKRSCPDSPVYLASSPDEALQIARETPDLVAVVVDWRLRRASGRTVIAELRQLFPELLIFSTSGVRVAAEIEQARMAGADGFIERDLSMLTYVRNVLTAIENAQQSRAALASSAGADRSAADQSNSGQSH